MFFAAVLVVTVAIVLCVDRQISSMKAAYIFQSQYFTHDLRSNKTATGCFMTKNALRIIFANKVVLNAAPEKIMLQFEFSIGAFRVNCTAHASHSLGRTFVLFPSDISARNMCVKFLHFRIWVLFFSCCCLLLIMFFFIILLCFVLCVFISI